MRKESCLIIHGYPDPSSFGGKISRELWRRLKTRHGSVYFHDLYAESFPALLPLEEIQRRSSVDSLVLQHQQELKDSQKIYILYPQWWGMPPAILKGWMDRVLAPQVAYQWQGEDFEDKVVEPLLNSKVFHLVITADQKLLPQNIERLWQREVLDFCGGSLRLTLVDDLRNKDYQPLEEILEKILLKE